MVKFPEDETSLRQTSVSITGTMMTPEGFATLLDKEPEDEVELPSRLRLQ